MRTGKIICECRIPTKLDSFDMPGYIFAESWKCATFPTFTFSFLIPVKEESRFLKWVPAFLFSSKNMPPPAHLSCFSWVVWVVWVVWNSQFNTKHHWNQCNVHKWVWEVSKLLYDFSKICPFSPPNLSAGRKLTKDLRFSVACLAGCLQHTILLSYDRKRKRRTQIIKRQIQIQSRVRMRSSVGCLK